MKNLKFTRKYGVCEDCAPYKYLEIVDKRMFRERTLPESYNKYHHDCPTKIFDYYFTVLYWNDLDDFSLDHCVEEEDLNDMLEGYSLTPEPCWIKPGTSGSILSCSP